jgi:hypothetical protein
MKAAGKGRGFFPEEAAVRRTILSATVYPLLPSRRGELEILQVKNDYIGKGTMTPSRSNLTLRAGSLPAASRQRTARVAG